jgi:hypothetical protein
MPRSRPDAFVAIGPRSSELRAKLFVGNLANI